MAFFVACCVAFGVWNVTCNMVWKLVCGIWHSMWCVHVMCFMRYVARCMAGRVASYVECGMWCITFGMAGDVWHLVWYVMYGIWYGKRHFM